MNLVEVAAEREVRKQARDGASRPDSVPAFEMADGHPIRFASQTEPPSRVHWIVEWNAFTRCRPLTRVGTLIRFQQTGCPGRDTGC